VRRVGQTKRPRLAGKAVKCRLPFLPETQRSRYLVWADASFRFLSLDFIRRAIEEIGGAGLRAAFLTHPVRTSPAEEIDMALSCIAAGDAYISPRYTAAQVRRAKAYLEASGHDLESLPLWGGGLWVFARSERTSRFFTAWWEYVRTVCRFDQIAIAALLEECGIEGIPFHGEHLFSGPSFEWVRHA
jgi:hypothetical protein